MKLFPSRSHKTGIPSNLSLLPPLSGCTSSARLLKAALISSLWRPLSLAARHKGCSGHQGLLPYLQMGERWRKGVR